MFGRQERHRTSALIGVVVMEAWRRSAALQDGGKTQGRRHLNGAEATPWTYSGSKMAAGRYQRAMHQFTSALQGGGLGTWLRETPELGHFNDSV
ncbi:hypothetical protein F7725_011023 [Dissostichus mawsoni]|uniref:A to I editase domain-containing protein n=1 Tax=Dissostichus mawsoni TaxID=36200 RepID=A0A7J5Z7M9_DISMA|nr:hypothetical protein F7725_011023 [Dissostichus mawsoni]